MNNDQAFAQGARCGHIEGKGRAGQYVIGEETALSWEAAENLAGLTETQQSSWASGYRVGYRLAAEGSVLPLEYAEDYESYDEPDDDGSSEREYEDGSGDYDR